MCLSLGDKVLGAMVLHSIAVTITLAQVLMSEGQAPLLQERLEN